MRYSFVLVFASFCLSICSLSFGQTRTLDDLNREKAKLMSIIEHHNKLMEEYSSRQNSEMMRISMVDNKIEKRQALIAVYSNEINAYNDQIRSLNIQIDSIDSEVAKQKEEYAGILRTLQVRSASYSPLAYILSSKSFNQSYRRFLFMRQYSLFRSSQFKKLSKSISNLSELKVVVGEKLNSINQLLAQIKRETVELNSEREARKSNVAQIQKNQSDLKQQILDAEQRTKNLEQQIVQVIKEEAEKARVKREEELARKKQGSGSDTIDSDDILNQKGNLSWPVRSFVVTSNFGEHDHPLVPSIKIRNNGVDIDILASKDIHPVFKGKVSRVIMIPGSTASIIIRHGQVLTVYSNLSEVYVKKDQVVDITTNLGKIYSGQGINSNILHFEIWDGDQKQNPSVWMKKQ